MPKCVIAGCPTGKPGAPWHLLMPFPEGEMKDMWVSLIRRKPGWQPSKEKRHGVCTLHFNEV